MPSYAWCITEDFIKCKSECSICKGQKEHKWIDGTVMKLGSTDIKKIYNSVLLKGEQWGFQQFVWHNEFGKRKLSGVKPRRNQSESGLRETWKISI